MQKMQQWSKSVVSVVLVEANHINCQLVERALRPRGRHVAVAGSAFRRSEVLALLTERQPDVAVISAQLPEGALEGYRHHSAALPGARVGSRCFPVPGARRGFSGTSRSTR
jgi:DNA-binding NarL/FixJ family response regulator